MHAYILTYVHTHTYINTCMHACIYVCRHVFVYTQTQVHDACLSDLAFTSMGVVGFSDVVTSSCRGLNNYLEYFGGSLL